METKTLRQVQVKSADRGEVSAVFSTYNVKDSDGDVTLPGAFTDGEEVVISAYGHTSWGGIRPVGKGRIRTTKSEAILDGRFFLDTTDGQETFSVVKALGGMQEWSFGYDVVDGSRGTFDGEDVQFLKKLKVFEVSPVLRGAGVNTRTLAVKSLTNSGMDPRDAARLVERTVAVSEYRSAIRPHESPVSMKSWDRASATEAMDGDLSIPDLRGMAAWCNPDGDPEMKSSYGYLHHEGPGAEANALACMIGIARLNGATKGGPGVPEDDRRGVYNHLAAHLQDADIDPSELIALTGEQPVKMNDRLIAHLAGLDELLTEVGEVRASRASRGKSIGTHTHLILGWMLDAERSLRSSYDSPQDDAAREYVRYVQSLQPRGEH